jgi:hypothetical protein
MRRTESSPQECRTISGTLPAARFGRRGSKLPGSPASLSCAEPAPGNGLSLPRNDCPFRGHHPEINVPGLLLQFPAGSSSGPFRRLLRHPHRFATGTAGFNAADPLPDSHPALPAACRISTPLQGFHPSGSKRSTRFAAGKLTFRNRPIVLRSPQPLLVE